MSPCLLQNDKCDDDNDGDDEIMMMTIKIGMCIYSTIYFYNALIYLRVFGSMKPLKINKIG